MNQKVYDVAAKTAAELNISNYIIGDIFFNENGQEYLPVFKADNLEDSAFDINVESLEIDFKQ